ncbi:MAG TPA: hypothetical protein VJN18_33160 [Polyangiaceae bacterium]|nr:hypothetical protein [Polyangiaceae bacterium]
MSEAALNEPAELPRSAEAIKPVEELACPYPGLRPFTEQEERWYFGREAQRDGCVQRLQQHRFLAVVGSSGSGKSSLVRAGLMPDLARGLLKGADERWQQTLLRPGSDPINALAHAVQKLGNGIGLDEILKTLRGSKHGLVDAIKKVSASGESNVLLVVDQFEELFRLGKEEQTPERWHRERVSFVELVLEAREALLPIYVVITMRTDFLEDCTVFPNLPEALNAGQYLVPNLTRAQLERAITTPAGRLGIRFSGVLVRQILTDAAQLRDALPVVQHAIMRTWKHWQDAVRTGEADRETIEVEHYQAIGTARGALDRHGDEILESLGQTDEATVKLIFQRLTLTNADGKVTRSPTSFENLVQLAKATGITEPFEAATRVINAYRADSCRFLMPPADEALQSADIDISHEAVFRIWRKLAGDGSGQLGWIEEEHLNRRRYVRLMDAALLEQRKEGQLLDDHLLADTASWWNKFGPKLEWVSRFHVLDKAAEAIVEAAKARFHQLEREKRDDEAARDSVLQEYRRELAVWHQQQFEIAAEYLERSIETKEAELRETERLKLAKARAERKKWIWSAAAVGLVILAFVIFQLLKINILQAEAAAAIKAQNEADAASDLAIRKAKEAEQQFNGLQQKVSDAQDKLRSAEMLADEARRAEQQAKENVMELETKLREVTKYLEAKATAAETLRRQNLASQAELKRTEAQRAALDADRQKLDRELSDAQRKLDMNNKCIANCVLNPFER